MFIRVWSSRKSVNCFALFCGYWWYFSICHVCLFVWYLYTTVSDSEHWTEPHTYISDSVRKKSSQKRTSISQWWMVSFNNASITMVNISVTPLPLVTLSLTLFVHLFFIIKMRKNSDFEYFRPTGFMNNDSFWSSRNYFLVVVAAGLSG